MNDHRWKGAMSTDFAELNRHMRGFTLIEMSIVLVIIGLIIGGILVGRDLISASEVRSQIAQIEKYNSAVNTFHDKFGGIPGDLNVTLANQFGFNTSSCDGAGGDRNGDGQLDDCCTGIYPLGFGNETALFWEDLSQVNLIDGEYPNSGATAFSCAAVPVLNLTPGNAYVGDDMPAAKIGRGNFVYFYETGSINWFAVSAVTGVGSNRALNSSTSIPVIQAYNIDKKVDDGIPTSGSVVAKYLNGSQTTIYPANAQANDTATSCYNTTNNVYSTSASANGGTGNNCALSFRFQ